ncbi:MAG: PaaI family thioesterase [Bacteroidetes bacterium]|nr:PaaI family thioesterase [Bacteroidota bacterium]
MESLKSYIQHRLKQNKFIEYMGIELSGLDQGHCELTLNIQDHHLQQNGFTHGGVTATLCDVATGIAAYTMAPAGKNIVTADLKISYMNPSTAGIIKARGKVQKAGNFLIFCDGGVYDCFADGTEKQVATCTAIMCAVDVPLKEPSEN